MGAVNGSAESSAGPGESDPSSQAGRADQGRSRKRRRVVAPPTSGQPEDVESQVYDPLKGSDHGLAGGAEKKSGTEGKGSGGASARDRWFLEQRPPHWD